MGIPLKRQAAPVGNTTAIEFTVSQNGIAVQDATGTVDVIDETDFSVIAQGLPVVYVPLSAGVYQAIAASDVFEEGVRYQVEVQLFRPSGATYFGKMYAYGIIPDPSD